jgi:Putative zinc-finger
MSWHVDEPSAYAYADGTLGRAASASIEAHVLSCADCRALLAPAAPAERLSAVWERVRDDVDAPRPTHIERVLRALRMPPDDARLLAAAPSLQTSWLMSVVAVLAFAGIATQADARGVAWFLLIAPLVPVLGVAGAYGRGIDPTYEMTLSTPYSRYRLLLLRVLAVLCVSILLTAGFALVVTQGWATMAWLLPSLAMVGLIVVLSNAIELPWAAGLVTVLYLAGLAAVAMRDREPVDLSVPLIQVLCAAVTAVCLVAIVASPQFRLASRRTP